MTVDQPGPMSQEDAEAAFSGGDPYLIKRTLLAITWHDPDWRWVQWHCIKFTAHADEEVRAVAARCLGHLAQVHGELDLALALPVLRALQRDPSSVVVEF